MDLALSDDERMLKDGIDVYGRDYAGGRATSLAHNAGCRPEVWAAIAEQGWLGVGLPEEVGGFGFGPVAEMLVNQGAGAALMTEPVLAVLFGARVVALAAPERAPGLLAPVFSGDARIIVAHDEPSMRGGLGPVTVTASATDNGFRLSGVKALISAAPAADQLVVSARACDRLSLFLVATEQLRDHWKVCRTIDGGAAAEIKFDDLELPPEALLAQGPLADRALAVAHDHAIVGGCADAVGAMDAAIAITRDYLNTRQQFGQLIGTFQALQHRLADMLVAVEQARSILLYAVAALSSDDDAARERGVSAAKVRGIDSARFVAAQAVQLHGGIGVTQEHVISHYFRRLDVFARSFGGYDHHLERYAAAPKETVLWA